MNMTEKNGQPSMEEILASIRRIIAEEPNGHHPGALGGMPIMLKGDGVLDDAGDFDLPAIFRSSPAPAGLERPAPLLGRLTDALRSATAAQLEGRPAANGGAYGPADDGEASANGAAYPALSSLTPVRPEFGGGADYAPAEPAPLLNGAGPAAEPMPLPAPVRATAADEPRRVMSAFKDTHFLRMSAPVAAIAGPQPVFAAPAVVEIAAAVAPVPVIEPEVPIDFGSIGLGSPDRAGFASEGPGTPPPLAAEPVALVSAPAVSMPPPPLPAAPVAAAVAPAAEEATGSIEDATADLLRPMLRQWLADNMPRMVEKALHIEIAESVKPCKKP